MPGIEYSIERDLPAARLLAWLESQHSWGLKLGGGHLVHAIEKILDLYLANKGPSAELQTVFNALAAREKKYGRVFLRLRSRPRDPKKAEEILRRTVARIHPEQKAEFQKAVESGAIGAALKLLPEKEW